MTLDQVTATLEAYRKEISEETKFFMPKKIEIAESISLHISKLWLCHSLIMKNSNRKKA